MNRSLLVLPILLLICAGCTHHAEPPLVEKISLNHGRNDWLRQRAIGFDIHIETAGRPNFDAQVTEEVESRRVRMQLGDNTILVFDGQNTWVSPPTATVEDPRQVVLNWPYIVTLPLRLGEAGAITRVLEPQKMGLRTYNVIELSFGPNAFPNANERYLLFADEKTSQIAWIAVVPRGNNAKPYALAFYAYQTEEGVILPREFMLWSFDPQQGLGGKPLAQGRLYNPEFYRPRKDAFLPPADSRKAD